MFVVSVTREMLQIDGDKVTNILLLTKYDVKKSKFLQNKLAYEIFWSCRTKEMNEYDCYLLKSKTSKLKSLAGIDMIST